ncbi:hypothetical protein X943_000326 [Babesia divergens]|uniref:Translation initiation factor beta propellor-like domain-containing protein n=1 Tax=Babesia divergens TaxID=32595 RepID=A0AAD9G6E7_BABDI|nr:hypothetical protein X943_000326 [Babesia divergens]
MDAEKHGTNMFLVHGKSGLFINSCVPNKLDESTTDLTKLRDENNPDVVNKFSCAPVWSLNRPVRHYLRSPINNVAIVDDRLGLSILHVNTECSSEPTFDTLRGVGKFRNLYTPIGCKNIKHLQWSNNGVYLVIYFNLSNYSKETGISLDDNLHIWDISQKTIVGTFSTRRLSPDQWPIIKWIGNTDRFAFCYAQQVSIYEIVSAESTPLKSTRLLLSIPIRRVFSVEVCEGSCITVPGGKSAVFDNGVTGNAYNGVVDSCEPNDANNERIASLGKDKWISLAAYTKADITTHLTGNLRISTITSVGNELVEVSCHDHELRSEDSAEMLWSPSGRYLLVLGQSTVDLAGERYGSTSNCLLFRSDGSLVCRVNAQTTHDARWSPTRDEFIVMEGNMPCDITLYDANCTRLFEFPKAYRNTIKWNPLGNMVALCGFGNLAGEICFWYRKDSYDYEQIVHFKEPCTVISEWSPDSRFFMTASTFPRMKVDNFLKVFNHEGDLLEHQKFEECYGVCWMDTPTVGQGFLRPHVRKSAQRKAIYRPKILGKDETHKRPMDNATTLQSGLGGPTNTTRTQSGLPHSKPPGSMTIHTDSNSDSSSWHSLTSARTSPKSTIPLSNSRVPRDTRYKGSLFSNDHGDKNDPSVDLLHAFKHVFAISQTGEASHHMQYDGVNRTQDSRRDDENGRMDNVAMPDKRGGHYSRGPGATANVQENAAKSLSMLMRIKNQLHCEKSKPLQQSILDEVQLLKLLLEAKNRSINRTQAE